MTVTASKLTTAPNDANKEQSQANQDAVTVEQSGNNIVVKAALTDLNSFASSNASQGVGQWVGLDIDTGLDSIVGATWNGSPLTQADVDEAASVGLGAGHIIFWIKANLVQAVPRQVTIGAPDHEDVIITVSVVDTSV